MTTEKHKSLDLGEHIDQLLLVYRYSVHTRKDIYAEYQRLSSISNLDEMTLDEMQRHTFALGARCMEIAMTKIAKRSMKP